MAVASSFEMQMLALINQDRAALGIAPLTLNNKLNDAAESHSKWMLTTDSFSHTGVGGSSSLQRMQDAGYVFSGNWASGENIAWQTERGAAGIADDVINLHQSLMNSAGHRANLMNPNFTEIGLGIEQGQFTTGGTTWNAVNVTQNFARSSADNGGDGGTTPPPSGLIGDAGANRLTGTAAADVMDGRAGNDLVSGLAGNDQLAGGTGADTLVGGSESDRLSGGSRADWLEGGSGDDVLSGGIGADSFRFASGFGSDRITDFADNLDTLVFSRAMAGQSMTARAFADAHATATGAGVLFDLGGGDQLLVTGVTSVSQLYDDILFSG